MPSSDLSRELREAAEKATPGPWRASDPGPGSVIVYDANGALLAGLYDGFGRDKISERTAAYIALCSPTTLLSLLDKADAAEAKIRQLEERIGLEMWRRNQATIRELKVKADAAEGLAEALRQALRFVDSYIGTLDYNLDALVPEDEESPMTNADAYVLSIREVLREALRAQEAE